eukprot:351542-Chlamydomonas_euryale.AAC.6
MDGATGDDGAPVKVQRRGGGGEAITSRAIAVEARRERKQKRGENLHVYAGRTCSQASTRDSEVTHVEEVRIVGIRYDVRTCSK